MDADTTIVSDLLPSYVPEVTIEEGDDGEYTMYLGRSPVVRVIRPTGLPRQVVWGVYGPMNADQSIAIMSGFIHLTALLANEAQGTKIQEVQFSRAGTRPPAEASGNLGPKRFRKKRKITR